MATLTIKNVPDKLVRRLKAQAAHHRRSLNLEVITCLEAATGPTQVDPEALLATARAIRITPKGLRVTDRLLKEMKNEGRP
ncbi:MAG: plasmid stability protein [Candidatus Rokuibacteriota bacterium]|nr:MAG: plasmid stability protein [Candidatus Rokubacteria bacterium]